MKNLIYYPNFEPSDIEWIKFALIYLKNFRPIVPDTGDMFLSDLFSKLQGETDLLIKHRPDYSEGHRATIKAIEYVTKVLKDPYLYSDELGSVNIVREWQNADSWEFTLFERKYSIRWEWFCTENKLGKRSDYGLKLNKSLAELYMVFLVQEIAYEQEASPITDKNYLDSISITLRTKNIQNDNKINVAKSIIKHQLPIDFRNITIDQAIKLRNRNGFIEKQSAFQMELENMYEKIGQGIDPEYFINGYKKTMQEWSLEISQFGIGLAATALSSYILINNDASSTPEYILKLLEAGVVLSGGLVLAKNINKTTQRKYCRQYLTELKTI